MRGREREREGSIPKNFFLCFFCNGIIMGMREHVKLGRKRSGGCAVVLFSVLAWKVGSYRNAPVTVVLVRN